MKSQQLISTRDAFGETLVDIGREMTNLVVLNADLSKATRTSLFAKAFPKRFFNAGIAEQNMMGVAAGLSTTGLIPIVSTLAIFATGRCYDQVRNAVVHSGFNVKIVATHSGISMGKDGSSHQSIEDIALMRVIPQMTVIVPTDAPETKKALRAAIKYQGPVYIRLGRAEIPVISDEKTPFVIGKANVLKEGSDLSIIACGVMVFQAMEAANVLASEGIKARVIEMHTIKPLDLETVEDAAQKTGAILTVEDHSIIGGLGSAVVEALTCTEKRPPVYRIGIRDSFGESGEPEDLFRKYGLSWQDIVKGAREVLSLKGD